MARKRYMVGPEGAYFDGRLWGQGQIIEVDEKQPPSKTWKEVDKDGNIIEPAHPATEGPQRAGVEPTHEKDDGDPKTYFGASKSTAKRRGEE